MTEAKDIGVGILLGFVLVLVLLGVLNISLLFNPYGMNVSAVVR